ncbi:ectoine synthase [Nocardioides insulae]|uniref:ectoine synthase n=1 Tax=Nocardioides insulae TaxID=394734 RepID=UPI0004151F0C|nr:ectoine synthase [Nocardioides insulae]
MKVTYLEKLDDTERDIRSEDGHWRSRRMVLAREGVGFSFHETNIYAGTSSEFWYAHHIEAVYCVEGEGELLDRETGQTHQIRDGMCYLLDKHDRHTVTATTDLRLICTFNPPVTGREVHDEDGVYPLITEPEAATEPVG